MKQISFFTVFLLNLFLASSQNLDSLKSFAQKYDKSLSLWIFNKDTASRNFILNANELNNDYKIQGLTWDGITTNKFLFFKLPSTDIGGDDFFVEKIDSNYVLSNSKTIKLVKFGSQINCLFIHKHFYFKKVVLKDSLLFCSAYIENWVGGLFMLNSYLIEYYFDKGKLLDIDRKGFTCSGSHRYLKLLKRLN